MDSGTNLGAGLKRLEQVKKLHGCRHSPADETQAYPADCTR